MYLYKKSSLRVINPFIVKHAILLYIRYIHFTALLLSDLPTFENAKKGDLGEIAPQKGRFFSRNQEILGIFFHAKEGEWGDYFSKTGDLGEV